MEPQHLAPHARTASNHHGARELHAPNDVAWARCVTYTQLLAPKIMGVALRKILRLFYWLFAIAVLAVATTAWWFVYRPLPQIDGSVRVGGLQKEVTVERDGWGVPHIRAASVTEL